MTTAQRIQKLGFKRWYERTLIESHAYLVTSFLGIILTFAGLELVVERSGAGDVTLGLIVGLAGVALAVFGMHRYFRIMALAGSLGDRATCPKCRTYAVFNVVASGPSTADKPEDADAAASVWLKVECRKCGNEWRI